MKGRIEHKKARFDYELLERYEAGIELTGPEVKALRSGRGSLEGAHITVRGGEAYLINAQIPPYQPGNVPEDYNPLRNRRLLLSKKEIQELDGYESKKGLTIVPLVWYNSKKHIKLELAVARGKKKHDKRETIRKREADRQIERTLKTK